MVNTELASLTVKSFNWNNSPTSALLGGAERLIVDMAVELELKGHDVQIFTSHYNKNRCFEETSGSFFCLSFVSHTFSLLDDVIDFQKTFRCLFMEIIYHDMFLGNFTWSVPTLDAFM